VPSARVCPGPGRRGAAASAAGSARQGRLPVGVFGIRACAAPRIRLEQARGSCRPGVAPPAVRTPGVGSGQPRPTGVGRAGGRREGLEARPRRRCAGHRCGHGAHPKPGPVEGPSRAVRPPRRGRLGALLAGRPGSSADTDGVATGGGSGRQSPPRAALGPPDRRVALGCVWAAGRRQPSGRRPAPRRQWGPLRAARAEPSPVPRTPAPAARASVPPQTDRSTRRRRGGARQQPAAGAAQRRDPAARGAASGTHHGCSMAPLLVRSVVVVAPCTGDVIEICLVDSLSTGGRDRMMAV